MTAPTPSAQPDAAEKEAVEIVARWCERTYDNLREKLHPTAVVNLENLITGALREKSAEIELLTKALAQFSFSNPRALADEAIGLLREFIDPVATLRRIRMLENDKQGGLRDRVAAFLALHSPAPAPAPKREEKK